MTFAQTNLPAGPLSDAAALTENQRETLRQAILDAVAEAFADPETAEMDAALGADLIVDADGRIEPEVFLTAEMDWILVIDDTVNPAHPYTLRARLIAGDADAADELIEIVADANHNDTFEAALRA